jgi:hypothetical protein
VEEIALELGQAVDHGEHQAAGAVDGDARRAAVSHYRMALMRAATAKTSNASW